MGLTPTRDVRASGSGVLPPSIRNSRPVIWNLVVVSTSSPEYIHRLTPGLMNRAGEENQDLRSHSLTRQKFAGTRTTHCVGRQTSTLISTRTGIRCKWWYSIAGDPVSQTFLVVRVMVSSRLPSQSIARVGKLRPYDPTALPLDPVGMPLDSRQSCSTPCQSLIGRSWCGDGPETQRQCQQFWHLVQRLLGWKPLKSVGPRSNAGTGFSDICSYGHEENSYNLAERTTRIYTPPQRTCLVLDEMNPHTTGKRLQRVLMGLRRVLAVW
jgi:hypothetical protein